MSISLYQKYRPQHFSDVVGQDHVRTTLLNELTSGSFAHAYLFSGPRGIGKTSSARLLARAVNCTQLSEGEPCNSCDNCTTIIAGKTLDVVEIDAASHTGVDHVREQVIDNARVAPTHLPYKVFIIDEVHMLSTSAFNALLKTLEEPPSHALFILATTELHKVPETIVSRCERFTFHRIAQEKLFERLQSLVAQEERNVEDDVLRLVSKRSEGCLRDAESLLGQVLSLRGEMITQEQASIILPRHNMQEMIQLLCDVLDGNAASCLHRVNTLVNDGYVLAEFMKDFIEFLRAVLFAVVQQSDKPLQETDMSEQEIADLQKRLASVHATRITTIIEQVTEARDHMSMATIPQLPLEIALITVCSESPSQGKQLPQQESPAPVKKKFDSIEKASVQTAQESMPQQQPAPAVETATQQEEEPIAYVDTSNEQPPEDAQTFMVGAQPVEEPKQEEAASAPQQSGVIDSVESVRAQWNALLEELKALNHALHLSFQVGQLVSYDNGVLTMGFQYQFYKDRLEDARNLEMIHTAFSNVFGATVSLDIRVDKSYSGQETTQETNIEQPSEEEVANVWDLASAAFGAEKQGNPAES